MFIFVSKLHQHKVNIRRYDLIISAQESTFNSSPLFQKVNQTCGCPRRHFRYLQRPGEGRRRLLRSMGRIELMSRNRRSPLTTHAEFSKDRQTEKRRRSKIDYRTCTGVFRKISNSARCLPRP